MTLSDDARYRWQVLSRVLAAIFGGYLFTSLLTVFLALVWPMPQAEAVVAASLLSFAVYTAAIIWVFSVRSATRAWVGLALSCAALALMNAVMLPGGWL